MSRPDDLSPVHLRLMVLGVVAAHVAGVWGLMQVREVHELVAQAAPMFFDVVATTPRLPTTKVEPPPPKPAPKQPPPLTPVISAAPSPTPAPFVVLPPPAVPVPPAPVVPAAPAPPPPPPSPAPAAEAPQQRTLPASAVQYLEQPLVVYPRLSKRNGETGLVVVRAFIGVAGGAPQSVQISKSSSHARLDEAAIAAVQKARFKPHTENGQPVEGWALIPINFELEK